MKNRIASRDILKAKIRPHLDKFKGYACSDAGSFAGNVYQMFEEDNQVYFFDINDTGYLQEQDHIIDKVLKKTNNLSEVDKLAEASTMGAALGSKLSYSVYSGQT